MKLKPKDANKIEVKEVTPMNTSAHLMPQPVVAIPRNTPIDCESKFIKVECNQKQDKMCISIIEGDDPDQDPKIFLLIQMERRHSLSNTS